jgi:excisionase family DNA binding protein
MEDLSFSSPDLTPRRDPRDASLAHGRAEDQKPALRPAGRCSFTTESSTREAPTQGLIPPGEWLSPQELADWLHFSLSTVYRMVERGELPFFRVSKSLRFCRKDIENYLATRRVASRV